MHLVKVEYFPVELGGTDLTVVREDQGGYLGICEGEGNAVGCREMVSEGQGQEVVYGARSWKVHKTRLTVLQDAPRSIVSAT